MSRSKFVPKHHKLTNTRILFDEDLILHQNEQAEQAATPEVPTTSQLPATHPQQDRGRIGLTCQGKPLKSPCTPKGLEYMDPTKFICVGASCVMNWENWS